MEEHSLLGVMYTISFVDCIHSAVKLIFIFLHFAFSAILHTFHKIPSKFPYKQ